MKRITLQRPVPTPDTPLYLDTIHQNIPIFAKRQGCIKGMVILEADKGWILRTGGQNGACGHYHDRTELLHELEVQYGYTLHVGGE